MSCISQKALSENQASYITPSKETAILTSTALSIILLLGSILAVLSQNGCQLGIFNAIPLYVPPEVIYTLLAASTAYLGLNCAWIAKETLRQRLLAQEFEKKELARKNFPENVALFDSTFVSYEIIGKQQVIAYKLTDKPIDYFVCNTQEKFNAWIREHQNIYNIHDPMPAGWVAKHVLKNESDKFENEGKSLKAKECLIRQISIREGKIDVLITNPDGTTPLVHYFLSPSAMTKAIQKSGCIDFEEFQTRVTAIKSELNIVFEKQWDAWPFEFSVNGIDVFGFIFLAKETLKNEEPDLRVAKYFKKEEMQEGLSTCRNVKEEINQSLQEGKGYPAYLRVRLMRASKLEYRKRGQTLLSEEYLSIPEHSTGLARFPKVYPLLHKQKYSDTPSFLIFDNEESKIKYIQTHLSTYEDSESRSEQEITVAKLAWDAVVANSPDLAQTDFFYPFLYPEVAVVVFLKTDQANITTESIPLGEEYRKKTEGLTNLRTIWEKMEFSAEEQNYYKKFIADYVQGKLVKTSQFACNREEATLSIAWIAEQAESELKIHLFKTTDQYEAFLNHLKSENREEVQI